jgi:hypothetical protein
MKTFVELNDEGKVKAIKSYCKVKDIREGKLKLFLEESFIEVTK